MGNAVAIDDMPEIVHEPYAFLLDETDVEPIVERNGNGRILLSHLGERTKMTIQFRLNGRKWQWVKSCLFIDGKPVGVAKGWDMYVAIFKDPDNGRRNYTPKGAKKAVIPDSSPVEEEYLPAAVSQVLRDLRKNLAKGETTVNATVFSKKNQYLVTVDDAESGKKIVFVFGFEGGSWQFVNVVVVNASGYDIGGYLSEDELEALLQEMLGKVRHDSQETYLPRMRQQGPAGVSNSVQVRKSVVSRV